MTRSGKRWLTIVAIILAIAAVGAGIWWATAGTRGPAPEPDVLLDQEVTVDEGSFASFEVELKRPRKVVLKAEVVEGPELDLFVLDSRELLEQYKAALEASDPSAFPYQAVPNVAGVRRVTQSARLGPGTFIVVADNSDIGLTRPPSGLADMLRNDASQVKIRISAER